MKYETILFESRENIATITLNRPQAMNGINAQMRADLMHAIAHAPGVARVIVITGAGPNFCSGQDLGDRGHAADLDLERTLREEYAPLIHAIHDCPVATISAVNGPAAGAGAGLALAADVVIAAHSASFTQTSVRIGLIPDTGATYWLPRQMGLAKAMGAALFAERVTARQAEAWGMIWECVSDDAFAATVHTRAAHLAAGPPHAHARIKQALRASFDNGLDAQLDLEARLQGEAARTRDATEGVLAFQEKRQPRFEGR